MRMQLTKTSIIVLGFAMCIMGLSGCPGSGSDDGESTIQGNVSQVAVALHHQSPESRFASVKEFFTLVRTAHAQSSNLEGIIIQALLNGNVIDSTVTDGAGNFELQVIAGTLTLVFEVDGVKISIEIFVPMKTLVRLGVSIDVPQENVEVEQLDYEVGDTIRCTNEDVIIPDAGQFEIRSEGDTCIFAAGNCSVEIYAASVNLNGCDVCVQALGSGSVSIYATEEVECEATETGLMVGGNGAVSMTALAEEKEMVAAGTKNLGLPDKVEEDDVDDVNEEMEVGHDNGEIEIAAPTAIDLRGTAEARLEAGHIKLVSTDHTIDAGGTSGLYLQARGLENGDMQPPALQTRVDGTEEEDEADEPGVIHLTSTAGSTLVTGGTADVTMLADRKVMMESSATAVEAGGHSNIEIGVGTGAGDGIETPDSGDADIQSGNGFGANISGSASVVIVANGTCTVSGASGDYDVQSNGMVSICE